MGENIIIKFDKKEGKIVVDRTNSRKDKFSEDFFKEVHTAPISFENEKMDIRLIIDAASVEIFVNSGEVSFTSIFFPSEKFNAISLFSNNGICKIINGEIYPLNSIWN